MVTVDESINQLFEQYYPVLKSYLYRLTASEQDAEDLASETFLRVMHKYESFEGEPVSKPGSLPSPPTWLEITFVPRNDGR